MAKARQSKRVVKKVVRNNKRKTIIKKVSKKRK